MNRFSILTVDTDRDDLASVSDYDLGGFDHMVFWHGQRCTAKIPESVRINVDVNGTIMPDYLGNPLSWPLVSVRFEKILKAICPEDVQLIDIHLYDMHTKGVIRDYSVVNVVRTIACLDFKQSTINYSSDKRIVAVPKIVIASKAIPNDVHMFRIQEWPYVVIISNELATAIQSAGMTGVSLLECKTSR
jgi:hypothetical protein